jgi:AcrR family transcriptional regulator
MATDTERITQHRVPLSRERVLHAAMRVADEGGIESLTMRKLAEELGVEAMSLYHHVANKEAVLDGVVDVIVGEVEEALGDFDPKSDPANWKMTLRTRILTARRTMIRHPWAPGVIETRTTISPVMMRYFNTLLGILREGGFSYDLGHRAMHAFGSMALGFTQELFKPDGDKDEEADMAMLEQMRDQLPYIVGMMMEVSHDEDGESSLGWCDDQAEFEFGLDLTLDGLERLMEAG